MELPCENGSSEGTCRSFYPGGAVAREWTAREGREEGLVTVYLQDGQRFSAAHFRDGRRHGLREVWLAGIRIVADHWEDGVEQGPYQVWAMTGQLLQEGQHHAGKRHGWWRFWGYTGAVQAEGDYADGQPVGDWMPPAPAFLPPAPALPPARRDLAQSGPVATTIVTGFLGAGKTTVILDLLRQKPADERWVVYVNEFGEVGIDAASLPGGVSEQDGLMVRELAGGCACCSSNLPFVEGISQAIDVLRPDHLIVEPTGLADAGTLIASLATRLAGRLELRATLCVVDPRRLQEDRYIANPSYMAQLHASDIVIANRCDLAAPEDMTHFRSLITTLPRMSGSLETEMGRVDLSWLTLAPQDRDSGSHDHDHGHGHGHGHGHKISVTGRGFVFPDRTFSRPALEAALRGGLPEGWIRFKGVLSAEDGDWLVSADDRPEGIVFQWRTIPAATTSRFECIVTQGAEPDWDALREVLLQASS
jgi:G3E family GTPase